MDAWVELGGTSGINLRMFKITWLMIFSFYIFHVWRHVSGVYQPRLPMPRGSHWPCHWRQQQWMAGCQCRSCHKALQARTSWIFMAVQRLILAYRAPSFGTSGAGDYIVLVSVGFCMLLCFFSNFSKMKSSIPAWCWLRMVSASAVPGWWWTLPFGDNYLNCLRTGKSPCLETVSHWTRCTIYTIAMLNYYKSISLIQKLDTRDAVPHQSPGFINSSHSQVTADSPNARTRSGLTLWRLRAWLWSPEATVESLSMALTRGSVWFCEPNMWIPVPYTSCCWHHSWNKRWHIFHRWI